MDIKYNIKRPSCYNSTNGKISLEIIDNTGKLNINWLNPPDGSWLSSDAKILNNIGVGDYVVEIEDNINFGKKKKKLTINIPQQDELVFDFIKPNQPICEKDLGSIDVFWSGGLGPYKIYCNNKVYTSNTNSYSINNLSSGQYTIIIEDSLECSITYKEPIFIKSKSIILDITYIPIKKYNAPSENIDLNIEGAEEPIKIMWFKIDDTKNIIYQNVKNLQNKLYSGQYLVSIIDNNNCHKEITFNISEPKPLVTKYIIRADYSYDSYLGFTEIEKIYNTIIFPTHLTEILDIKLSDKIIVTNKSTKKDSTQIVISEPRKITLNSREYYAINIATGVPLSKKNNVQYLLSINNNTFEATSGLSHRDKQDNIRIISSAFIMNNNLNYKFRERDTLQVLINNDPFICNTNSLEIVHNFYTAQSFTTILNIDNNDELLYKLNRCSSLDKISIMSLKEKIILKKGSIFLDISGGVQFPSGVNINGYKYKVLLYNYNKHLINTFFTNDHLNIVDLDRGTYYIDIRDIGNNTINYANQEIINTDTLELFVPGSIEEEQKLMNPILIEKFNQKLSKTPSGIPKFYVNKSNLPSLLLSFKDTKKITISGPNNFTKELNIKYYLLNNLTPGTYNITDGNNTKTISLFSNNHKVINNI